MFFLCDPLYLSATTQKTVNRHRGWKCKKKRQPVPKNHMVAFPGAIYRPKDNLTNREKSEGDNFIQVFPV